MNTFAFVGDLEGSPEVSCVYHSEEAENQVGTPFTGCRPAPASLAKRNACFYVGAWQGQVPHSATRPLLGRSTVELAC